MNIEINLTEKDLEELIQKSIDRYIDNTVEKIAYDEFRIRGFDVITSKVVEATTKEMPKYFEEERAYIINKAVERLIKGLKISSADVITALLALSKEE